MTKNTDSKDKASLIPIAEAILFSAGDWIEIKAIKRAMGRGIKKEQLIEALKNLQETYNSNKESAIIIKNSNDLWKMDIKGQYLKYALKLGVNTELSKSVIETLGYIAWKAPIIQSKVVKVRSTKVYDDIKELVKLSLISKRKDGKSYLLELSKKFYDYFEMSDKEVKKTLKSFEMESKRQGQKEITSFDQKDKETEEKQI